MIDPLTDIFTFGILRRLRKCADHSPVAEFRYRVLLSADLPNNCQDLERGEQQSYEQAHRRWQRWIAASVCAGLFREPYGAELRSRLTGIDHDGFRSALAECMTCWALSTDLGLRVLPRPSGRGGRILEFAVRTNEGDISFEVKSPRLPRSIRIAAKPELAASALITYSAAVAMRAALRSANRQFVRTQQNILVIASPQIEKLPANTVDENWPAALIRAFYGEQRVMTVASGGSANQFLAEVNFLRRPGGAPRFTRISAVVGLRDSFYYPNLQSAVLHNPCSLEPVDSSIFGTWDQFGAVDGEVCGFRRSGLAGRGTIRYQAEDALSGWRY